MVHGSTLDRQPAVHKRRVSNGLIMNVYRLSTKQEAQQAYPCAMTSPSPFWYDGLPLSRAWFAANLGRHVEGLHLQDDAEQVIGHLYWAPSGQVLMPYRLEYRVAYIYCEWIQRQCRGQGGMRLLFETLVDLLWTGRYKGLLVHGTESEDHMHYHHFAKRGFQVIREVDDGKLMYLPLSQWTVWVEPLSPRVAREGAAPVEVLVIGSLSCPVGASAVLAVRKVAAELGGRMTVKEIPAGADALARYRVANGIFVNGKARFSGPVTERQVRRVIQKEMAAA
jgi:hypothetical protein